MYFSPPDFNISFESLPREKWGWSGGCKQREAGSLLDRWSRSWLQRKHLEAEGENIGQDWKFRPTDNQKSSRSRMTLEMWLSGIRRISFQQSWVEYSSCKNLKQGRLVVMLSDWRDILSVLSFCVKHWSFNWNGWTGWESWIATGMSQNLHHAAFINGEVDIPDALEWGGESSPVRYIDMK